jgi:prepilin-type N-terminal cleavage/methylation domain-containing protein
LACRRATDPGGFSLLELIIALTIMGLLGALAMPSLIRITDRTRFSLDRQDLERQLDQLPQIAVSQGRNLVLTSTPTNDGTVLPPTGAEQDPYPVKVPDGWRITVDAPIRYRYDGTCSGGKIRVALADSEAKYVMNPPLCELRPG